MEANSLMVWYKNPPLRRCMIGLSFRNFVKTNHGFIIVFKNFKQIYGTVIFKTKVVIKKIENFLLPTIIELFETNRMSHFPPFYDDFFL